MNSPVVFRSPLYIALLLLTVTALAIHVSYLRITRKIVLGDGGDKTLFKAMRRHGNSLEHATVLSLLAIVFDLQRAPFNLLHWGNLNRSVVGDLALMAGVFARILYAAFAFRHRKLHPAISGLTYLSELTVLGVILVTFFFGD